MSSHTGKVLITGSSGFVGNYILLNLAKRYPQLTVLGMSRSGKARTPEIMKDYPNVEYVKGNCLEPDSFK